MIASGTIDCIVVSFSINRMDDNDVINMVVYLIEECGFRWYKTHEDCVIFIFNCNPPPLICTTNAEPI